MRLLLPTLAALMLVLLAGCSLPTALATMGPSPTPAALAPSDPTRIRVASLGVDSTLVPLGLNPDHTVQVPSLNQARQAGWYRNGPTPGARGPAVVLGHIDGDGQAGVFANLARASAGDAVEVDRSDGTTVRFRVSRVELAPKTAFPTDRVYGETAGPELRLISCGGRLDRHLHSYDSNVIVYATSEGVVGR